MIGSTFHARRLLPALLVLALLATFAERPNAARAAKIDPGHVIVQFDPTTPAPARAATIAAVGASGSPNGLAPRVLRVAPGVSATSAASRLGRQPGVRYAVPDFVAHASGLIPNDPGRSTAGGWRLLQWNFLTPWGVNAPDAWAHLVAAGAPGGRGVTVAVLDTGVAYTSRGRFRRSPDLTADQFVRGYDFVGHSRWPVDHNGHGTHVASTIAEATNNGVGLTGLAYGARIMPLRVLNSQGEGDASAIAAGVRFAVTHRARIINLSLEFSSDVRARQIPELVDAIAFAHRRGVFVVGASGNEGSATIVYPARARYVISVGATTEHGCISDFSNGGPGLGLVAPGGGTDAQLPGDPNCHAVDPPGRDIFQVTFTGQNPRKFGIPTGYQGTSMATPHVAATAALIIASGLLGPHPSPDAIFARLRATARDLGPPGYDRRYGWGLIDAAAATDALNRAGLPASRAR